MSPPLYLDTARMGRMSPTAQNLQCEFARFGGEVGASCDFDDFLLHGLEACPHGLVDQFPGLSSWKGMSSLKRSLCQLTSLPDQSDVLIAARSVQLMKLAANLLCRPCRNILVTDTGWSPYRELLDKECQRTGRRVTTVPVGHDLISGRVDEEEVIQRIRAAYLANDCDGLLLTAVSNLGIRLPVNRIVKRIEQSAELWFVVVDGAQDFCHVGADLQDECADLYLAGAHKWLRGYYPLGLAFYSKRRSQQVVQTVLRDSLDCGHIDDPLLGFLAAAEDHERQFPEESVNLASLFSCQGAVCDATESNQEVPRSLATQLENSETVEELAHSTRWQPEVPDNSLRSGILLLKSDAQRTCSLSPEVLRAKFHENGIVLTAYDEGRVRLSMPIERLQDDELRTIRRALTQVA